MGFEESSNTEGSNLLPNGDTSPTEKIMEEGKSQNDTAAGTSAEHEFRYVAPQLFLDTGMSGSGATGQSQTEEFPNNEDLSRPVFDKGPSDSSGRPISIINPPVGCLEKTHRRPSYNSLPTPTSIRLVKLYNFTGSKPWSMDEPIRCSLVVADLADGPDYFALSYTWGNPRTIYTDKNDVFSDEAWASPAFEIDCDGHAVSVATNLYTALLSMRGSFSEGAFVKKLGEERFRSNNAEYSYIWVDALCINQDDLQEKGNQIPIMDRIYSQARATIMWLGGEEPLIKQGFPKTNKQFLLVNKRLREVIGPRNEDLVMDRCLAFDIFDPKAFEQLGLEPVDLADLVGWYLLYSRSWFKRAWVVQECVLSPSSLFLCGTLMFSVRTVCTMLINLARQGWALPIQDLVIANLLDPETMAIPTGLEKYKRDHRDSPLKSKYLTLPLFRARLDYSILDQLDESLVAVWHLRHFVTTERSKTPPRNPSSQELWKNGLSIKNFRGRRCMDPRDKIYAFHGMFKTSDGRSIFPSPDYLKSVSEVYTEATRAILLDTGISFLHFREFRSSNPHGLPSWVPDYQVNDGFLYLHNTAVAGRDPSTFFTAAASLGAYTLVFKENNTLGLVGCHVDTVVRPEPFRLEIETMGADCRHLLETLLQIPEESLVPMPPSDVLYPVEGTATPEATKPTPEATKPTPEATKPTPEATKPTPEATKSTSEATKQSRFEVLWRTLVQDKRSDYVARHPAPSEVGDALIGRLNRLLESQCAYIVAKDIVEVLEHWKQESTQCDDSQQFFDKCSPLLRRHKSLYQSFSIPLIEASDTEYDRRTQVDGLLEMNAVVEILQGNLPIESKERPSPKMWTQHQWLWESLRTAIEARDCDTFDNVFTEILHNLCSSQTSAEAEELDDRYDQQRTLFTTSERRLGLIADGIERGDEIWVIQGLDVPVALRCVGDGLYSLVGVVYVHGIMHGEAVLDSTDVVELDLV